MNPFETKPVNALQALMQFDNSYEKARGYAKESKAEAGQLEAADALRRGDYEGAANSLLRAGKFDTGLELLKLRQQQQAGEDFSRSIGGLYGGQDGAGASPTVAPIAAPAPASALGRLMQSGAELSGPAASLAPVSAPDTTPRQPVPSTSRVWGDQEAESAGLYEPSARQPQRYAQASPGTPPGVSPSISSGGVPILPKGGAAPDRLQAVPAQNLQPAAMPQVGSDHGTQKIQLLIRGLSNPNLPQAQRSVGLEILKSELDGAKLPSDVKEYTFARASGDPSAQIPYTEWTRGNKRAGATNVTVDQKGESAFEQEFGKKQADRWNGYITASGQADRKMVDINSMREISDRLGSQGAAAGIKESIGPYAEALGVNIEGLSDIQAYSSIVERLAPQNRVAGSGSTSDVEFKGMLRSMPGLMTNPNARTAVLDTMESFARDDVARGEIATRLATKETTRAQAETELRKLGDPMERFRAWRKANPKEFGAALSAVQNQPSATPTAPAAPRDASPIQGARKAQDGNWYVDDPQRPGKFLQVR